MTIEHEDIGYDEWQLQSNIDSYLELNPLETVKSITLCGGMDVTNLESLAEVRVAFAGAQSPVELMFSTPEWITEALRVDPSASLSDPDIYTGGVPIIPVIRITGSTIVRGVRKYFQL